MKQRQTGLSLLLLAAAMLATQALAQGTNEPDAALDAIGTWDGTTPTAALAGPYEDPLQMQVPFGRRSFYLSAWRAYMDTWPASRFLECLGVNFQVSAAEADAVAQLLAEAGIRSARVEFGWGGCSYEKPDTLQPQAAANATALLQALHRHGIRPLLLLNAHHGVPCPLRGLRVTLAADAAKGDRAMFLRRTDGIIPGYTGPNSLTDYKAAAAIITAVDTNSGRCELSKPLSSDLKAGQNIDLSILKFKPFGGAVFADGQPNPAAEETLGGWMQYVTAVCRLARESLGTEGQPDCGFDLEVWNEYTFGSDFLDERNYYDPPRPFKEPIRYSNHGRTAQGPEILLPMTVDFANEPTNGLPGCKVLSGFANQRPWENGTDMWPGQAGFSRHYYTGVDVKPLTPENAPYQNSGPVNALGGVDGKSDGKDWHTVIPGTFFIPALRVSMPERWHYIYQTEFMTRDVQPFPGPWARHGRYTHPGTGLPAQVWMTEFNFDRWGWAESLMKLSGCAKDDPHLIQLMHHVGTKATLRSFVFHSHKGIHTIDMFAVKGGDLSLGIIPDAFFAALATDKYVLTDHTRALAGPQLEVLRRVTQLMRTGQPIESPRKLTVSALVEHQPRLVFRGDGTAEHPDRFQRDDFACLPFQLAAGRFAIAYYVVTRNTVHDWDKSRDLLDPGRYDMPEQTFDITLANVRGRGVGILPWERARVSVWDPMTDRVIRAETLATTPASLTVRLPTVDYPRFLLVEEREPGPLVVAPALREADGATVLSFATNVKCQPMVTWGPYPAREGGGHLELPAGSLHNCVLPPLGTNVGVRITAASGPIQTCWPLWAYDVQGVLHWPDQKDKPAAAGK